MRSKLLATLTVLAAGTTPALSADLARTPPDIFERLTTYCLYPETYDITAETNEQIFQIRRSLCCQWIRQLEPQQVDLLTAIAIGNYENPLLKRLNGDLLAVILSCSQEAVDRLVELSQPIPNTPPVPPLYIG